MDPVDQIEHLIASSSDGFFDEPAIREDLHVTLRIATNFHDFLVNHINAPNAKEIGYMMGTIRSGIDQFFLLAYFCNTIHSEADAWTIDRHAEFSFPELRTQFLRSYEELAGFQEVTAVEKLTLLLALTHLELLFLAQYFPSALIGDVSSCS